MVQNEVAVELEINMIKYVKSPYFYLACRISMIRFISKYYMLNDVITGYTLRNIANNTNIVNNIYANNTNKLLKRK